MRLPPWVSTHWDNSQNSGKCYTHNYGFTRKDTNRDQPKEETHGVRCRKMTNMALWCPLPTESGCIALLELWCIHQTGSSTKLWCLDFSVGFHYIAMIDWIIGCGFELNFQLSSSSTGLAGSNPQPSNHTAGLSGWPVLRCDSRGSWITKTFLKLRKFQRFRVPYSETKVNQILYYTIHALFPINYQIPIRNIIALTWKWTYCESGHTQGLSSCFLELMSYFFSLLDSMSASTEKTTSSQLTATMSPITNGRGLIIPS